MKNDLPAADIKKLTEYKLFSAINDDVDFSLHSHDYFEIMIVLEDGFSHIVNDISHSPAKGDIVILRPGDTHRAAPEENKPHRIRDIYCTNVLFKEAYKDLCSPYCDELISSEKKEPLIFSVSPEEADILDRRLQLPVFANNLSQEENFSPYMQIIKKAVITEILGLYCRTKLINEKTMPECVAKLITALQKPEYINLSITEMAFTLGYSHNYLCARFKEYFGKTIQQFITERKIERAARMLTDTSLSVESIGKALGWTKTSCFISNFRRIYGTTPLQYRKGGVSESGNRKQELRITNQ